MAGTKMSLGAWKRWLGDAVALQLTPRELGLTPAQVGALVKRNALTVHAFRLPQGPTIRMVRRSDLDMVKASMRKPQLRDLVDALQIMASQP
jgi:hypothetical protein